MRVERSSSLVRVLFVVDPVPNLIVNCFILGGFCRRIVARSRGGLGANVLTSKLSPLQIQLCGFSAAHPSLQCSEFNYLICMPPSAADRDMFVMFELRGRQNRMTVTARLSSRWRAPHSPHTPLRCRGPLMGSLPRLIDYPAVGSAGLCGGCGELLAPWFSSCTTALPASVRTSPLRVSDRPAARDSFTSSTRTKSLRRR